MSLLQQWIALCLLAVLSTAALADVSEEQLQEWLTTGRVAIEDGLYGVAEVQLRHYLDAAEKRREHPPGSEEAGVLMARALYGGGRYESLLGFLDVRDRWVRRWEQQDAVRFWRGMALHKLGRDVEALDEIAELGAEFPEKDYAGRVLRLKAWCLLALNRRDEAADAFAEYERRYPDGVEARQNRLEWGKVLVDLKRFGEARVQFERLTSEAADDALAHEGAFWLGRALRGERMVERAVKVFQSVAGDEAVPAALRSRAYAAVASIEEERGRLSEAVVALRTALELAGEADAAVQVRYDLGRLLLQQGRYDEAAPLLKASITAEPDCAVSRHAQLTLAQALLGAGRSAEAAEEFQYYLETYTHVTGQAEASFGRGSALFAQGRLAEAAMAFEKAFGLHTNDNKRAQSLFRQGDAYLANSQYGLADESYSKLVELFPDSELVPGALFQKGESLARGGKPEQAEAVFKALSGAYPGEAVAEEAMLRMARLKEDQGEWEEAVGVYNGLMATYSNGLFYAEALYGRGAAHFRLFRFADALADFELIEKRFMNSAVGERAAFKRAMSLYWLGRDEEAIAVCRTFAERRPDSELLPDVLYWLGKSNFNRGSFAAAEEHFRTFHARFPDHRLADDALLLAARAASRQHEYVRAIETLAAMFKHYPESDKLAEGRFAQANALVELANYSAAILVYDEIINNHPDSGLLGAAWGRKGDCQFTLGAEDPRRYQESIESYRVVANNPAAAPDEVLQAAYKIGRCLEKLGRLDEALEQYYAKVIVRYLREGEQGVWHNEAAKVWFTRAAFSTADIMESREDWRGAVRVLERVAESNVPASDEARERIEKIRSERWWLFY